VIRRIRLDEVEAVADLYVHQYASELDEGGKPPIVVWLQNCALHPNAFCLVAETDGEISGFVIASVHESAVLPCRAGELEELWVQGGDEGLWTDLAREAIVRLRWLGARTVRFDVATGEIHAPLLERLGFEGDAVRYSLYES
jgi:hypothetical protein